MPKVEEKTKSKVGKEYTCGVCSKAILPGEKYFEWSFRYAGTRRQHASHGHPKPSQLTNSKMSGVYAAVEACEEAIDGADNVDDMRQAVEDCKGEVETVRDEYQDSFDNIPENLQNGGPAQEMTEKIQALEDFMNELEGVSLDDFEEDEPLEPEAPEGPELPPDAEAFAKEHEEWETEHANWEQAEQDHLESQRDTVRAVLEALSV